METLASFNYTIEQIEAIEALKAFPWTEDRVIALSGPGGAGKSACINEVCNYYDNKRVSYQLCAPTNKAASVLKNYTNREVCTIHSLLKLAPKLDVIKLDMKSLIFANPNLLKEKSVLIIDEASMVNSELYDYLTSKYDKIIAIGDVKQLAPVKEAEQSKFFTNCKVYYLTKIFRQKGNGYMPKLISILRDKPIRSLPAVDSDELVVTSDIKKFFDDAVNSFENCSVYSSAIICYTNKRVDVYNKLIKDKLFGDKVIAPGMLLVGNNSESTIENGQTYKVVAMKSKLLTLPLIGIVNGFEIVVTDGSNASILKIIADEEIEKHNIAQVLENLRLKAIKNRHKWPTYFNFSKHILTMKDVVLEDGRIAKKALFSYGYAITAHRAQGSGYNNVFMDLRDMNICKNDEDLRQLQYVGMSRAIDFIEILK